MLLRSQLLPHKLHCEVHHCAALAFLQSLSATVQRCRTLRPKLLRVVTVQICKHTVTSAAAPTSKICARKESIKERELRARSQVGTH